MEENNFLKITNALYKILDFLPETDPLKSRAKQITLAILENLTLISGTKGWVSLKKEMAAAQLLDDISVLQNYLVVGRELGWIDNMNFLIISREYDAIKKQIPAPKGFIKESLKITASFPPETQSPGHAKNNSVHKEKEAVRKKYSQRQEKILEILAGRPKAQVSDFIKELPNVTKRTIRRDLDELLKDREIMRVGEWNQVFYTLQGNSEGVGGNEPNIDRTKDVSYQLS